MKKKKLKRLIRKRYSLLLEVLLALALVSLCLVPLLKPLVGLRKAERQQTKQLSREHDDHLRCGAIKQMLFEREIAWEDIPDYEGEDFTIKVLDDCNKHSHEALYLLLEITVNQNTTFSLVVKKEREPS